jgi:hypothetical protein
MPDICPRLATGWRAAACCSVMVENFNRFNWAKLMGDKLWPSAKMQPTIVRWNWLSWSDL